MIVLNTYAAGWGQPSLSPFCVKAMYLLNLSGRDWKREDTLDPRRFPKGKLPAIQVDGQIIGDSDNIRDYLIDQGADFDAHLSALEQADMRAYQRMSEEHLYYQIVQDRWANDAVWPHVKQGYFGTIPALIRGFVTTGLRKGVVKGLAFVGHGRATADERMARIEQDLTAISTRLWQSEFLFGDRPCSADASLGPMLAAAAAAPVETALSKRIKGDKQLMDYVERVAARMG